MWKITKRLIETDDGKAYVRYTPTLTSGPCLMGEVTFAPYDVEVGSPKSHHDRSMSAALNDAKEVLRRLSV